MVGLDKSIPNRMGTFTGTKAHILMYLGIVSPESGNTAEFLMLMAFWRELNSFRSKTRGLPNYFSLCIYSLTVWML